MSGTGRRATRTRSIARKLAMQALYQWQLTRQPVDIVVQQFREADDFNTADAEYFSELLTQCVDRHTTLDQAIAQFIDRPLEQLDPVEHAILLLGMYELLERLDVPYKVVINEAVGLSKRFGATESHKYVNAILDRASSVHRTAERSSGA